MLRDSGFSASSDNPTTLVLPHGDRSELFQGLRGAFLAFRHGSITPAELNRFIRLSYSLALSQLANRRNTQVLSRIHGLNTSDLALDCIGDLFQRNEEGRYIQLQTYVTGFSIERTSDAELLVHLRRLISSKVRRGIFRLLQEADPSLGKILRNVKLSISSLHQFDEVERFGEPFLRVPLCDPLEHLPEPAPEDIERALMDSAWGPAFVPELLARLSMNLRSQAQFRRTVSLVDVALALRSVNTLRAQMPAEVTDPEDLSHAEDATTVVRKTMKEVRRRAERRVEKKKIRGELLEQYCAVVEESLSRRLVHANGQDFTLFGSLRRIDPTISRARYRRIHRSRLEYLARMAKKIAAYWVKHLE